MDNELIDINALNIYCDGAMDYNSKNSGGVGIVIIFPESLNKDNLELSIGKYVSANIERLELEAILIGMKEVIKLFENNKYELNNIKRIIFKTDRHGLNDKEKTNPYKIREWRKNKWHNNEGKAIKNSFLLDDIDKARKKIIDKTHCRLEIQYGRRKFNKVADKLAKAGKKHITIKSNIALHGIKIGKRKYDNTEIDYNLLKLKNEYNVHIYKKEPVQDQWEISAEFCEGQYLGMILKIYSDSELENKLHRHHYYKIKIKNIFNHHVNIYKTIIEVKYD